MFLSCFVRPDEQKIDQGNNWVSYDKYKWSPSNLNDIREVLCDHQSSSYRSRMINALVCHTDNNEVARTFDNCIHQAFERACVKVKASVGRKSKGPKWYDQELRLKRSQAINAGENTCSGQGDLLAHCREYRSLKQRKQREYKRKCLHDIELAYKNNKSSMWSILNAIDSENIVIYEYYDYFKNECDEQTLVLMNDNYEQEARAFLDEYDKTGVTNFDSEIETYMIIMNFSEDEISSAIDSLKSSKSPGLDAIPAESIKHCRDILARDITTILNYIIEEVNFPDMWAEGLRFAVFKSGKRSLV